MLIAKLDELWVLKQAGGFFYNDIDLVLTLHTEKSKGYSPSPFRPHFSLWDSAQDFL